MKKYAAVFALCLLLCGCAAEETYETIADELVLSVMAQPREVQVMLPEDTVAPVLSGEQEQIFAGDTYEIMMERRPSGDLNATIQALSGYGKDQLTVIQTRQADAVRSKFVWVSAGEQGERLGRAVILDDGSYHYCLSVLQDAQAAQEDRGVWSRVFQSFALV